MVINKITKIHSQRIKDIMSKRESTFQVNYRITCKKCIPTFQMSLRILKKKSLHQYLNAPKSKMLRLQLSMYFNNKKQVRNGIWVPLEVSSQRADFSLAESICFPPFLQKQGLCLLFGNSFEISVQNSVVATCHFPPPLPHTLQHPKLP